MLGWSALAVAGRGVSREGLGGLIRKGLLSKCSSCEVDEGLLNGSRNLISSFILGINSALSRVIHNLTQPYSLRATSREPVSKLQRPRASNWGPNQPETPDPAS